MASRFVRELLVVSPKVNGKLARLVSMVRWEGWLPELTDVEKDRAFAVSAALIELVKFLHAVLSRFQRGVELRRPNITLHNFLRW